MEGLEGSLDDAFESEHGPLWMYISRPALLPRDMDCFLLWFSVLRDTKSDSHCPLLWPEVQKKGVEMRGIPGQKGQLPSRPAPAPSADTGQQGWGWHSALRFHVLLKLLLKG